MTTRQFIRLVTKKLFARPAGVSDHALVVERERRQIVRYKFGCIWRSIRVNLRTFHLHVDCCRHDEVSKLQLGNVPEGLIFCPWI